MLTAKDIDKINSSINGSTLSDINESDEGGVNLTFENGMQLTLEPYNSNGIGRLYCELRFCTQRVNETPREDSNPPKKDTPEGLALKDYRGV